MKEKIGRAVADIFSNYEETRELQELKEEIAVNLTERMVDMQAKGMGEEEALRRALNELGDVTEAADELSRRKRQEWIGQAYSRRVPLDRIHAIGYPAAGIVLLFGFVVAAITGFRAGEIGTTLGALMPFLVSAGGAFTYLGCTQETRTHHPITRKRAIGYTVAACLLLFGGIVCGITLFRDVTFARMAEQGTLVTKLQLIQANPVASLGSLIPFVLPGLAVLAFLLLTETDRRKPWVLRMEMEQSGRYGESFGLLSGALWMLAVGVFLLLGLLVSWRISWVVFVFATAAECMLLYFQGKKSE